MNILELRQVSKAFGPKQVLDELNLVVPTGSIFGFV
ncbi:MAG: ABC transporter ATP-binding protein, partial [Enterococcus sp.]|nr:ABC transporter ATP-binding protein [Enterococcus sp.]